MKKISKIIHIITTHKNSRNQNYNRTYSPMTPQILGVLQE